MSSQGGSQAPKRNSVPQKRNPLLARKSSASENGSINNGNSTKGFSPKLTGSERPVKKLRLSKALTIAEGTTVSDACKRMAARRADAVLLTDANALLSGIVTDKDIAVRVIAEELRPDQTAIAKVMTRNPIFVASESLAIEALQKMVKGKFRHLPVVENGEVTAMLDITKCLYDAISRLEKSAEHGSVIAAAVEGVERQYGSNFNAPSAFIESLRERMFKPPLCSIIPEGSRVATVFPSDPVQVASKRMRDSRVSCVLIMTGSKIQGILTSRDILMRVVATNLPPELTPVEKVMTPNPECATAETTILEALHIMHDAKFLHLPVLDKDGTVIACLDVLEITHAAISMVDNSSETVNDVANTVMQKFWDSALNLDPPDDYDNQSDMSMSQYAGFEATEQAKPVDPSLGHGNAFAFKFVDNKGRVHRLNFVGDSLPELVLAVAQRAGDCDQLLYEDDEGDKVLLSTDDDLVGAISNARLAGQKVLRLHLCYPPSSSQETREPVIQTSAAATRKSHLFGVKTGIFAGAVVLASVGVLVYLKRTKS